MSDNKENIQPSIYFFFGCNPNVVNQSEFIRSGGHQFLCYYCGDWFTYKVLSPHESENVRKSEKKPYMDTAKGKSEYCSQIISRTIQLLK